MQNSKQNSKSSALSATSIHSTNSTNSITLTYIPLTYLTALSFSFSSTSQNTALAAIESFLQGQLTCDLKEVTPSQSRLFSHCNLQGRMTSLGRIIQDGSSYFLIIPKSIAKETQKNLQKYAQFSRIIIQEVPDLFFYGLEATNSDIFQNHWPQETNQVTQPNPAETYICVQNSPTQTTRWLCLSHEPFNPEKISLKNSIKITQKPESYWLAQEIQNFSAYLTPETSGKFLPHDINLPALKGVSFTKGCFLGQEIIARMEHLGKLKKKMKLEILDLTKNPEATNPEEIKPENIMCECEDKDNQKIYRLIIL